MTTPPTPVSFSPPTQGLGLPAVAAAPTVLRSSLRRPAFWIVAGVLLAGAVGLNAASSVMKLYFRKEALPLRAPEGLMALPREIGSWVMVPEAHTVDADLIHSLGTDKYVFRKYVDTGALGRTGLKLATKEDVLALQSMEPKDRSDRLARWFRENQGAWVELAVTYYTGKVDTVPHVPDRCMVAGGFQPVLYEVLEWPMGIYTGGAARRVPVRFIDFQFVDPMRQMGNRCVTYFFHANGKYMDDPNAVRSKLQSLNERCGYFAKIEVMTPLPTRERETDELKAADRKLAMVATQKFLTVSLPEIEKLLPDWEKRPR